MSARAGRARRAARGVSAAVLATFVATLSHTVAAGELPAVLNVVLALSLASPLCIALVGRTVSRWRLTAAIAASQLLFHSLLALDLSGGIAAAGHHTGATALAEVAASGHSHGLTGTESPWMWVAHALAAAVTVVALGSGERALRAVAGLLSDTFRALAPVTAPRPRVAPRMRPEAPLLTVRMTVLSVMRHRGPPLAA